MRYIVALLGILLFLSACSSEEGTEQSTKKPSTEQVFLEELDREFPDQKEFSNDDLVTLAKSTCETLDEGYTVKQLFSEIGNLAENEEQTRIMAEAASEGIAAYCPEHRDALVEAANTQ